MKILKRIVEGKIFNVIIETFIIISLITFPFETLPNLTPQVTSILYHTELVIIIIFTIEYILRLIIAGNIIKRIFSINGIIDLLAFLPFYIVGADFRGVRIFRLFRMFRLFSTRIYTDTLDRFKQSFKSMKYELFVFLLISLALLYISGTIIYYFEHEAQPDKFQSMFDGLWWSIITFTTTGYGDLYPITVGGKIFTTFMLIIGVGVIIVPSSLFASTFHKLNNKEK